MPPSTEPLHERVRAYFLARPEAWEDFPFGPDVNVYKVGKKMFGTLGFEPDETGAPLARINLKCDPEQAIMLRDVFLAVVPGYHMNKAHWNTVMLDGSMPIGEIERMIDVSFGLVVKSMKKVDRTRLELRHGADALYSALS